MNLNDPGIYSTSCNIEFSEAEYVLNLFMRHHPKVFIAKGETEKTCGPCQLTSERDWWIYNESSPQIYFKEVNANE